MTNVDQLVRPHIKELAPYSSARDEYKGSEGVFLNANENPYGRYNRYPDSYQAALKNEIGNQKNIDRKNIFLGNGSDEIIDLLIRLFCQPGRERIMTFEPTFGMYEVSARINNVELLQCKLDGNFQINPDKIKDHLDDSKLKLIFICSPNNPTGNVINPKPIQFILEHFDGIVVIDEAYIDFSSTESWISAIEDYPNLVVLQTLSKARALAGLRIGMGFANQKIIQYLNNVKPPYNISAANQQLALERLKDQTRYQQEVKQIIREKKELMDALPNCPVVEKVYPSDANFILIKVKNAKRVYRKLIEQGVVVRNRSKKIKNSLRITVGTPSENKLLIKHLKNIHPRSEFEDPPARKASEAKTDNK